MRARIISRSFCVCGMLAVAGSTRVASGADTASDEGPPVTTVSFVGSDSVSDAYLRSVVATTPGLPFDGAVADQDVRRLLRTRKFAGVEVQTESVDGGIAVTFHLIDRPVVKVVRIEGNVKLPTGKLLEVVSLREGDPVDAFAAAQGRDEIEARYRDAGYGNARVTYDADRLRDTGELVYVVEEGVRIRVRRIVFEGNDAIPASELSRQIATKTYLWVFREGRFDRDMVESDAFAIQAFYRDKGYLDARASYRLDFSETGSDLTVVFTVAEGQRYTIEAITFRGNSMLDDRSLANRLGLRVGDVLERPHLDRGVKAIQAAYGENGHIYAQVRAQHVFSDVPGLVRLTVEIEEGEQIRVGRVVIRGNERTRDKVVRRQVELYPNGIFNLTAARDAERGLLQTQIFGKASITPVGTAPGVRDALVHVEESTRAGDLIFGAGVTSNSGLVGSFIIDIKNFDLYDWPLSFSEFIKMRAFHGGGQRLRVEAQPGTELNRFRIDFTEPFFLDRPVSFGLSAYLFTRGRDGYGERRVGGNVSLGKRIERGPLTGWYGEVSLRAEDVNVDPQDIFTPREIRQDRGSSLITSVKATLVRDRTDNRFIPTRGDRVRLSWEQVGVLGGDHVFAKLTGGYSWHKTLFTDVQDRKSVLSIRADAGAILGEAPVFERFYAGGIGSIRGFQFRGVGPRAGIRDDPIGGDLLLLLGTEYSFPLYGETLRGVVFSDMGTVGEDYGIDAWRMTVGVGVRMVIEFLGPVPLEFNLAAPVASQGEDEDQAFSFFIGAVF